MSIAIQQSLALGRLACYEDCASRIRAMLGREVNSPGKGKRWIVRKAQLAHWQIPVMLLNLSILLLVFGLLALLQRRAGSEDRWHSYYSKVT